MEEELDTGGMEEVLEEMETNSDGSSPADNDQGDTPAAYGLEPLWGSDEDTSGSDSSNTPHDSESASDEVEEDPRLQNTEWCNCGRCVIMATGRECLCCQEMPILDGKLEEGRLTCVTENRYFNTLCIDREVLDVAMLQVHDVRGDMLVRPTPSRFVIYHIHFNSIFCK